jgi:hypothetical protein
LPCGLKRGLYYYDIFLHYFFYFYGLWIMDYGLWIMDYGLWIMDKIFFLFCSAAQHQITNFKLIGGGAALAFGPTTQHSVWVFGAPSERRTARY